MKVLIVDDNIQDRMLLSKALSYNKYKVIEAEDGVDALEKIKNDIPDIIISDIMMPRMDGFMLLREIRTNKSLKDIPFIIYSAKYKDKEDIELAKSLGISKFITKPEDIKNLISQIDSSLMDFIKGKLSTQISTIADKNKNSIQEQDYIKKYTLRIFNKLEEKVSELEKEIEERKRVEDALKKSEKLSHTGSWTWYIKINKIVWSDEMYNIFDITKGELQKFQFDPERFIDIAIYPDDRELVKRYNKKVIANNTHDPLDAIEYRAIRKDGSIRYIYSESGEKTYDKNGNLINIFGIVQDITERKLSEEKLRKSEENLKYAQRVSLTGNWEWDISTQKITWSEETFLIHALDPKKPEPNYDELLRIYNHEDIPAFTKAVEKCMTEGKPYTVICRINHPDGSLHYLEGKGEAIRDEKGDIVKLFGTSSDITEKKQIENELRISTAIFENLAEGIYLIGLDNLKIKWVNPVLEKMFGYNSGEMIGKCVDIVNASNGRTPSETRSDIIKILKRDGEWHGEIENIKKDGTRFWCYVNVSIFDHPQFGKVAVFVHTDITEYKESKNKLQLLRNLIDKSNDSIFVNDPITGIITDANDRACSNLGYSREELIKMRIFDLEVDISKKFSWKDHVKDVKSKKHVIIEGRHRRKDSTTFPVEINVSFIELEHTNHMFSIVRDITERKLSENKIKKINEDLKRSNEELDQFAYIASHDLQEPLRTIYSFTDLIAENYKGKLDPEADEFIDFITSATRRMQQMINDLLALSRVGTRGKPFIDTDIKNVISTVLLNLNKLIKDTNAIITYTEMPIIPCDENQMVQLFQNLIDNAIKFRRKDTIPKIHIFSKKEYNRWVFSIQDNGIGIDERQFKKLFIIFSRLHSKEEYPGTGIGLAMCKKIVKRHGGDIWVESKIGEGSTFYFTISPYQKNGNGIK